MLPASKSFSNKDYIYFENIHGIEESLYKMVRNSMVHDDVIKWKYFLHYWPFVRGNSLITSEFPSQRPVTWSFDVFFDLCLNNCGAGDLRCHPTHYDITVIIWYHLIYNSLRHSMQYGIGKLDQCKLDSTKSLHSYDVIMSMMTS